MKVRCPWRFGDKWYVMDFIQIDNPATKSVYEELKAEDVDVFIRNVADWVRDEFTYPFMAGLKLPSAGAQLLLNPKTAIGPVITSWHKRICKPYTWKFPTEVLIEDYHKGICIDTSNLALSVLRIRPVEESWVALGWVRRVKDDSPIGAHAWNRLPYKGDTYVLETTIHEPEVENMILASEVYDKTSDWAKRGGIYYDETAYYDERGYHSDETIIYQLGPISELHRHFGIFKHVGLNIKKWMKNEIMKQRSLWSAWAR